MGLFGDSPQKKLEKARAALGAGDHYEALRLFEEVADKRGKLSDGELSEAARGSRICREKMIGQRLEEAETLRLAGDLEAAADKCNTASDLAGADLDRTEIEAMMRRIEAPRRPVTPTGEIEDAAEDDLLPEAEPHPLPTPVDHAEAEEPEPPDEQLFGEDSGSIYEIHLSALEPETAEYYQSLGEEFQRALLALIQGAGRRAMQSFDLLSPEVRADARVRLEAAHALLLARRAEESLAEMEAADLAQPGLSEAVRTRLDMRRRYLRCEAFRLLGRYDEALELARSLADQNAGSLAAESLLAWTQIEAGRAGDAYARLKELIDPENAPDELVTPAAAAAQSLGLTDDERALLEMLVQRRLIRSAVAGEEVDFPIQAGRRLLQIYVDQEAEPEEIRTLLLHMIDFDPEGAEEYREMLLEYR